MVNSRHAFAKDSWTWSSPSSNASSERSSAAGGDDTTGKRASFGFEPVRTVDEFSSRNGRGPNIRIEEERVQDGVLQQTLKVDHIKLTLSLKAQPNGMADGSERIVTVSKRRWAGQQSTNSSPPYEVVYTWRGPSASRDRRPPASVDELANRTQRQLSKAETTGEAASVTKLVEEAAAAYGSSVVGFIAAVRAIAPELGTALADPLGATII